MAATGCYGARRLSDLLREQQEPFLQLQAPQRRSPVDAACAGGVTALGRSLLCGGNRAATKALLWGGLAGCFTCGVRQTFRCLPRAGDIGGRCDVASELGGEDRKSVV